MNKVFKTSEEKRLIINHLKPFFKSQNIIGKNRWALLYQISKQINNNQVTYNGSFVFSSHTTPFYVDDLALMQVENLILEVEYPNHDFSLSQGPFHTINNNSICPDFNEFEQRKDYIDYAEAVKLYIETDGQKFIDHYSYLPNVLAEMDKLEKEGRYWNGGAKRDGILSGGGDGFFRGLIISKLCNDVNLENKIKLTDDLFYTEPDAWTPYYNKLKERLKTLEPIYNV